MRGYALNWVVDHEPPSITFTLLCLDKGIFIVRFFK
jgi:hypothetical protein